MPKEDLQSPPPPTSAVILSAAKDPCISLAQSPPPPTSAVILSAAKDPCISLAQPPHSAPQGRHPERSEGPLYFARSTPPSRNPIFWARTLQIALLCIITFVMIGATKSQYERIGNKMICSCSCNQILLQCNHIGCPDSPGMIRELHSQVATGGSDNSIYHWFAAKYGPTILAAPILGGFDDVAWIVPIAVFLLATLGTFAIVFLWKRRAAQFTAPAALPPPPTAQESALHDRIRRETEYE